MEKHLTLTGLKERLKSISKIEHAIASTPITIQLKKYGKEAIGTQLMNMILELSTFFNLGKNMTEEQSAETAALLLEKYPVETLEDFSICFKKAKTGEYGKVYDRLDGHIIFEWFSTYLEEKYQVRERIIQEEKKKQEKEQAEKAAEIDRIRQAYKTHKYTRPRNSESTVTSSFVEALRQKYKVEYQESLKSKKDGNKICQGNDPNRQHPPQPDREDRFDG